MTDQDKPWGTDAEIRELLNKGMDGEDLIKGKVKHLQPLLKELLSYRALKFLPCWRVWCPDPNPSGWRPVAAFASEGAAIRYRAEMRLHWKDGENPFMKALVLEGHEQPSITAR